MALNFDDRILGEKTDYYCSSSEDEGDDSSDKFEESKTQQTPEGNSSRTHPLHSDGAPNTGPKGVVEDWRRYKQLQSEWRQETEKERLLLAKRLAITCRTSAQDEEERLKDEQFVEETEEDLDALDEEFMQMYRRKRFEALRQQASSLPKFGRVLALDRNSFLDAIDKEDARTTVVVHIYKKGIKACNRMHECLATLSCTFPAVKFCSLDASQALLSVNFSLSGVPAMQVYKGGELIGNFVKLRQEFGEDFCASDVESFLVEHGLLPDDTYQSSSIRTSCLAGSAVDAIDDDDDDEGE